MAPASEPALEPRPGLVDGVGATMADVGGDVQQPTVAEAAAPAPTPWAH